MKRYKQMDYNINAIKKSACVVFDPVIVDNFASRFIARRWVVYQLSHLFTDVTSYCDFFPLAYCGRIWGSDCISS